MLIRFKTTEGVLYLNAGQITAIRPTVGESAGKAEILTADRRTYAVEFDFHEVAQVVEAHLSEYVHSEKRLSPWHLDEAEA